MFLGTDLSPPFPLDFILPVYQNIPVNLLWGLAPQFHQPHRWLPTAASAHCSRSLLEKNGYQFLCFDIYSSVWYRGLGHLSQGMTCQGPGSLDGTHRGDGVPWALPAQPGARQGPGAPAAPVWQGRRTRAESHIAAELAEVWYLTTEVWHEHIETRCMENKATEWPWPTLIFGFFIAVHALFIF